MQKQNTANVYSQLGGRKKPEVILSRRPKNLLKQRQCHNASTQFKDRKILKSIKTAANNTKTTNNKKVT